MISGKALIWFGDKVFIWSVQQHLVTTITVELTTKWSILFIVDTKTGIRELTYSELGDGDPSGHFCDHCPRPMSVLDYAERNGFEIDDLAWELIVGRWMIEVQNYGYLK